MAKLSDPWKAALKKPIFVHLTTVMADGSPQASPVWIDVDGDAILVNSAQGRIKDKNMRRDPRVALSAVDPDNPYTPLMLRGKVVEITSKGAARTSIRWPRNTSARTRTRFDGPAKSVCSIASKR